jgi:tRNA A-37 threonylcarbamoyl transferase component Bud32
MPPLLQAGGVVAGFRVESAIASGAMATVYLAEQVATGDRVALKILAPELDQDERFRQRFLRESKLAAGLQHPNVVPIVASGEDGGLLYLAMAYVEGSDLREILRREGRLAPERALGIVGQVAGALDAAHAEGLVHRDVKPANILVASGDADEVAYLCDFGLARHISSTSSLTGERGFVGTIDYVSPEQIEGGTIDGRADVYSLGCVLYESLTSERPFARESELSVVFAHLNEAPPAVSTRRPELPKELDGVFATALAKSPGDRYSTCGELASAGRAALAGKRFRRRPQRRGLLVAGPLLLAAIAAAIGVAVLCGGGSPAQAAQITTSSVDGARLGLQMAAYKRIYGIPWRADTLNAPNFPLLIFVRRSISVYFTHRNGGSVEITTWNKAYRTDAGVGPCSTLGQVKAAYGEALKPSRFNTQHGRVFAYTVGNIIFSVNGNPDPSNRIQAVAIYRGITLPYSSYIVLSESPCT